MIKKIKASLHEKLILIFLILLGVFSLSFTILIKNKCLFVKNVDPQKTNYSKPNNIVVLNAECGNVIIELYPEISPNGVERFKKLINSKSYDNVAFHRVIKDKLVQAGDIQFGKKNQIDYGKIGTGKSGLGTIKSEIDAEFNFYKGSVGLARSLL
jgi:peptidyl-prolyl cis-trans isomerase A (cyclophilin A)